MTALHGRFTRAQTLIEHGESLSWLAQLILCHTLYLICTGVCLFLSFHNLSVILFLQCNVRQSAWEWEHRNYFLTQWHRTILRIATAGIAQFVASFENVYKKVLIL